MIEERLRAVRPVTGEPRYHFFGYYDKTPWDLTGGYILALEVTFQDRSPTGGDTAVVGLVDLQRRRFEPLATTHAWNWQQGCMLQWLPSAPDRQVIYNDRDGDQYVAVILDVPTGRRRVLPRPIYALSHDGKSSVFPNFSRLAAKRPGYGYAGVPDPWQHDLLPADDGIYSMNLETGDHRLLLSLEQIAHVRHHTTMDGVEHWCNHLQFSPDSQRFVFLHRWRTTAAHWSTQLMTASPDGSRLCCVADDGLVSHFDWQDSQHILAWASQPGGGDHYYLFEDGSGRAQAIGADVLPTDGHCSYAPKGEWILTDTYPDAEHMRTLLLYHPPTNLRVDLAQLYSPPELGGEMRCDLHPRWSRDGRQVCIDSAHTGYRQMYVLDVDDVTRGENPLSDRAWRS